MNIELEDRLYTSTEVANILGVSLRSVYRYLEDRKLVADIKTATGRHRFTKQNIIDFLSPQARKTVVSKPKEEKIAVAVQKPVEKEVPEPAAVKEPAPEPAEGDKEDVDWLSKFRTAAEKYKQQDEPAIEEVSAEQSVEPKVEVVTEQPATETVSGLTAEPVEEKSEVVGVQFKYYKSGIGGLKEIAQNIDKSARKSNIDYAFTSDAGLSLHKPIRPFAVINSYVRPENLDFFEKMLELTPADESSAQLCLQVYSDESIYQNRREMHGLYVVSDEQLKADLVSVGKEDLAKELE